MVVGRANFQAGFAFLPLRRPSREGGASTAPESRSLAEPCACCTQQPAEPCACFALAKRRHGIGIVLGSCPAGEIPRADHGASASIGSTGDGAMASCGQGGRAKTGRGRRARPHAGEEFARGFANGPQQLLGLPRAASGHHDRGGQTNPGVCIHFTVCIPTKLFAFAEPFACYMLAEPCACSLISFVVDADHCRHIE